MSTYNVISWPVDGRPYGLSVNRTGNALVTCGEDNTIKEYSTGGSLVRTIKLQVNQVILPHHTVQLTDGQYVVSHHRPEQGVSLIDQHGAVVATISKVTQQMNGPRWIVVVNNSLLVADRDNNRILLLDSLLNDARELSLPVNSQLKKPRCMYLDMSNGRLYVGEVGGRVLVFQFECLSNINSTVRPILQNSDFCNYTWSVLDSLRRVY